METASSKISVEVELQPGEKLALPESRVSSIGLGRWVITLEPWDEDSIGGTVRGHSAFLKSYDTKGARRTL